MAPCLLWHNICAEDRAYRAESIAASSSQLRQSRCLSDCQALLTKSASPGLMFVSERVTTWLLHKRQTFPKFCFEKPCAICHWFSIGQCFCVMSIHAFSHTWRQSIGSLRTILQTKPNNHKPVLVGHVYKNL